MTEAAAAEAGDKGAPSSPEGADKGQDAKGSKGKEKAPITPSADEATPADKGAEKPKKVAERPEHIPENFWDKEKGEPLYEEMAKSWTDLRKKVSMRSDDLEKKIKEEFDQGRLKNRPESAEKYELRVPEGKLPVGVEWQFNDKDPLVAFARNFAFESGLGQDGFDNLVGAYIDSKISELPDIEAETKRLGEKGKERVERVDNWMQANISPGAYAAISSVATKAEVIVAIEELMQKAGAPAFAVGENHTGGQEVLNDALVRSWMADPKYWDPQRRDQKFVEKVDKAWQKMYPTKK